MSNPVFIPVGPKIPGDSNNSASIVDKDLKVKGNLIVGNSTSTVGFFGVEPVAQPSSASVTDYASLKAALQDLGLIGS